MPRAVQDTHRCSQTTATLPFQPSQPLTSTTTRAWGCRWFTSCTMALMPPVTCSAVCPWLLVPTQTTTICGKRGQKAVLRRWTKGASAPHTSPAHLGPNVFQFPILQTPQYMLCAVTTNAKVKCMQRREELPPDLWARGGVGTGHPQHIQVW
jgi:hypothetical protein